MLQIVRLANEAAFSFSGNRGLVDTLLAKAEIAQIGTDECALAFEDTVRAYQDVFEQEWRDKYEKPPSRPDAAFLFCGYIGTNGKEFLHIVKLDSRSSFIHNPSTRRGWAWAGAEAHGAALYLHHRFYREAMLLEQLKLLVYSIVAEVADQDNMVAPQSKWL